MQLSPVSCRDYAPGWRFANPIVLSGSDIKLWQDEDVANIRSKKTHPTSRAR